jgi:hypothetical protein
LFEKLAVGVEGQVKNLQAAAQQRRAEVAEAKHAAHAVVSRAAIAKKHFKQQIATLENNNIALKAAVADEKKRTELLEAAAKANAEAAQRKESATQVARERERREAEEAKGVAIMKLQQEITSMKKEAADAQATHQAELKSAQLHATKSMLSSYMAQIKAKARAPLEKQLQQYKGSNQENEKETKSLQEKANQEKAEKAKAFLELQTSSTKQLEEQEAATQKALKTSAVWEKQAGEKDAKIKASDASLSTSNRLLNQVKGQLASSKKAHAEKGVKEKAAKKATSEKDGKERSAKNAAKAANDAVSKGKVAQQQSLSQYNVQRTEKDQKVKACEGDRDRKFAQELSAKSQTTTMRNKEKHAKVTVSEKDGKEKGDKKATIEKGQKEASAKRSAASMQTKESQAKAQMKQNSEKFLEHLNSVCPRENGFCVKSNGGDQNSGVHKINSVDGNSASAQTACYMACKKRKDATGCEVIWHQGNRGCYVHTQSVARGNSAGKHYCWVFSKCKGSKKKTIRLLSQGKNTAQASHCCGGSSARAVDGNHRQDWGGGTCTHTANTQNAWWRVDLVDDAEVTSVKVWNRSDCCGNRLNGFQVRVGNSGSWQHNKQCGGNHAISQGQNKEVDCSGKHGRYTHIVLPRRDYLTLCEVEVRGYVDVGDVAMVINGGSNVLHYDSGHWTSSHVGDLGGGNSKTHLFNERVSQVTLEFKTGSTTKTIGPFPTGGKSLREMFQGGWKATSISRDAWKNLAGNRRFGAQNHCNRQGWNNHHLWDHWKTDCRLGIIMNQEGNCNSPDSAIGIGFKNGAGITAGGRAGCCCNHGHCGNLASTVTVRVK